MRPKQKPNPFGFGFHLSFSPEYQIYDKHDRDIRKADGGRDGAKEYHRLRLREYQAGERGEEGENGNDSGRIANALEQNPRFFGTLPLWKKRVKREMWEEKLKQKFAHDLEYDL